MSQHAKPWTRHSFQQDFKELSLPQGKRSKYLPPFSGYSHATVTEPPVPTGAIVGGVPRDKHMIGDTGLRMEDLQGHVFNGDRWVAFER